MQGLDPGENKKQGEENGEPARAIPVPQCSRGQTEEQHLQGLYDPDMRAEAEESHDPLGARKQHGGEQTRVEGNAAKRHARRQLVARAQVAAVVPLHRRQAIGGKFAQIRRYGERRHAQRERVDREREHAREFQRSRPRADPGLAHGPAIGHHGERAASHG